MRALKFSYPAEQFTLWRILFGFYLLFYAVAEFPLRQHFFGPSGNMPLAQVAASGGVPAPLAWLYWGHWSGGLVDFLFAMRFACAAGILFGVARRSCALLLYAVYFVLYNRNLFTLSGELGLVAWLLPALALVPPGEPLSFGRQRRVWEMPAGIYWSAWIVLAAAYTASSYVKLRSPFSSWGAGEAIHDIFQGSITRYEWSTWAFSFLPAWLERLIAYSVLVIEGIPLLLLPFSRILKWWWVALVAMHLMVLAAFDLAQLTFGLLLFHFFLYDASWCLNWERASVWLVKKVRSFK